VTARSGRVIAVATEGDRAIAELVEHVIHIPHAPEPLAPLIEIAPLAAARLSYRRAPRMRCGSAAESGEVRHGGVARAAAAIAAERTGVQNKAGTPFIASVCFAVRPKRKERQSRAIFDGGYRVDGPRIARGNRRRHLMTP
jgi:hypothetical protein